MLSLTPNEAQVRLCQQVCARESHAATDDSERHKHCYAFSQLVNEDEAGEWEWARR